MNTRIAGALTGVSPSQWDAYLGSIRCVFEPLEPVVRELVNEGEEVTLTIETGPPTPSDDAFRETAGSWRGLIDAEALKAEICRDRLRF